MSKTNPKYTPRGYQNYILDRIEELPESNLLLELDCGLGKRFITHQLVVERYPNLKFIIVVHSSSSLAETVEYLRGDYGGLEDELGEISSRVRSPIRPYVLKNNRVVVSTPQILAGMIKKEPDTVGLFDILLINEVDTLIKRTGRRRALTFPWPTILPFFDEKRIIGMSGTLRDEHAVFNQEQLEIRKELRTLKQHIPSAQVISMEDLYGTDIEEFLDPTELRIKLVRDTKIQGITLVLDELIRDARSEIMTELAEYDNLEMVENDPRRVHLMLERLPVSDDLKGRYSSLLMLRKYVYAMPPQQFIKFFYNKHVSRFFDPNDLRRALPKLSSKAAKALEVAKEYDKSVILTSYLDMVSQIESLFNDAGLITLTITGQTQNKGDVLTQFKTDENVRALVMSPVGERDLDIPQADVMLVSDTINTTKTMYQKFKRTRGGVVLLLAYENTSEERKAKRLIQRILERYPWSTSSCAA
jgi:superfamily II DNA or RNA helicase